ncbi:MAG: HlyC/CorC family transporter [Alphaproteobacteria bacterium]|nr:HlyC/CorC family transporter [Alphaproteobacteria bacterium]
MIAVIQANIELILTCLGIVILLVLSAFFSGSETALTASSRARMHHMAQEGDGRAAIVNRLLDRKERLIGALLLGNNLVNIAASALATGLLIAFFGEAGIAYATIVMTLLVLIFSEVLPKTYAINRPDRVALFVSRPVRLIVHGLAPMVMAVERLVVILLRLFGVDLKQREALISGSEELRGALELHEREGSLVKLERDMLDSILDLQQVQIGDIMVHRQNMQTINGALPPEQIVAEVIASTHTRLPVWQDDHDNIIGILHARDLLRAVGNAGGDLAKIDIASLLTPPWFVPETNTLQSQLNAFRRKRMHFALVVDEYGALMGLVTLEDILEEIVGDISDEHDKPVSGVRPQPDGSYLVDGSVTLRDLNRQFDWGLPDDEAATIAGLVIHEARVIPEVGQAFVFHDFTFEVLRRHRHRIALLRVRPPVRAEGSTAA